MITKQDIINKLLIEDKISFTVCDEWLIERNGNKVSVNHTYHFKGESFNNLKDAVKYLKIKVNYLVKKGYQLNIA